MQPLKLGGGGESEDKRSKNGDIYNFTILTQKLGLVIDKMRAKPQLLPGFPDE